MERRNIFSASTKRTREKINYILKVILTASIRFDEGQCGHVRLNRIRAEPHKENENESIRRNEFLGPPTADAACADLAPVVPAYHHPSCVAFYHPSYHLPPPLSLSKPTTDETVSKLGFLHSDISPLL